MLGDDVKVDEMKFQPFLPDRKTGYLELEQVKPGIVICPHCGDFIDVRHHEGFKACVATIQVLEGSSWASTPICRCPGVWAVYDPEAERWAFRYRAETGDMSWQNA